MKVVQVTPFPVYPPSRGAEHRSHGLMIGKGEDDQVLRFSSSPIKSDRGNKCKISDGYAEFRSSNLFCSIQGHILNKIDAPRVWESSILRFTGRKQMSSDILDADVVIVDRPWQVPYIVEQMDDNTPLVYSSHNVEYELYSHLDTRFWTKKILSNIRRLEQFAIERSDLTVTMSSRDKRIYRDMYDDVGDIHVSPAAGYSKSQMPNSECLEVPFEKSTSDIIACFVGNNHYPNVEAVEEIRLMAEKTECNIQYIIIGNVCEEFNEDTTPGNLHLLGFVEDIEPWYQLSNLALNPIVSGSGVNIKMLEYFQHGLPTLSTPFGARGIEAKEGIHYLEADIDEFSRKIQALVDPSTRQFIADNAKDLIEEQLNWETVSRSLFEELRELCNSS